MKNLHLVLGLTAVGFVLAVGCGDDAKNNPTTPGEGGDGGTTTAGKNGSAGSNNNSGKTGTTDGGAPQSQGGTTGTGDGGMTTTGGTDPGPGCGDGPLCNEDTEQCLSGKCLLNDGEACTANAECVHVCIGGECAPRAEVLGNCDYSGAGGAGTGGAGGAGGAGGEGGIYVPPEENGNGEDLDCLDGLACDSGTCKRKQMTNCTGPEQCLSGLCHKGKCTLTEPGECTAAVCPAYNNGCAATTTMTNQCSFNYLPNSTCTDFKFSCLQFCQCNLAP